MRGERAAAGAGDPLDRYARLVPYAIVAYFVVQAVVRVALTPTLDRDQAGQILLAQTLAWGYPRQPPLYTWLQWAVFEATGPGLFGLVALKTLILSATPLAAYAAARALGATAAVAALAALGLFLLPQYGWESQRALADSALVTTCAMITVLGFATILRGHAVAGHAVLLLGVVAGVLTKANFLIFLAAAFLAALAAPTCRRALFRWPLAVTLALAALLLARPGLWVAENMAQATAATWKLRTEAVADRAGNALIGLGNLAEAALAFVALIVLVYLVVAGRDGLRAPLAPPARWLGLTLAIGLVLCVLVVLGGATQFKERWLLPVLAPLPLFLALWLGPARRPARRRRAFAGFAAAPLAIALGLALYMVGGPRVGLYEVTHIPYAPLTRDIRALGFERGTIVAERSHLAGNLRAAFPDSPALCPYDSGTLCPAAEPDGLADAGIGARPVMLAWRVRRDADPPADLVRFYAARYGPPPIGARVHRVSASYYYAPERTITLGVMILPPPADAPD